MPEVVDDATPLRPSLTYGAQKLIGEVLVADFSRRGWIDGFSSGLPGIVARPPEPSGLLSAFMSDIFWTLSAGRPFVCPVRLRLAWWNVGSVAAGGMGALRGGLARAGPEVHRRPARRRTSTSSDGGGESRRGRHRQVTSAPAGRSSRPFCVVTRSVRESPADERERDAAPSRRCL